MAREKGGAWVDGAEVVLRAATRMIGKRVFDGGEHIPAEGPALLVFNHVSYLDPAYDAVFVRRTGRVPRFMAKNTLWKVPVLGAVLRKAEQIPVYRGTTDARQSLRAAHEALSAGKIVAIYPEGTITRDPEGWPMESHVGIARLALENDVPVIPIARWGTQDIYDHYHKRFRPLPRKPITIRAGEPVDLSAYRAREQSLSLLREVTDVIMVRVRDLLAEIRGEQAPTTFHAPKRARPRVDKVAGDSEVSAGQNHHGEGTGH